MSEEVDLIAHLAQKKREVAAVQEAAAVAREQALALIRLQRRVAEIDALANGTDLPPDFGEGSAEAVARAWDRVVDNNVARDPYAADLSSSPNPAVNAVEDVAETCLSAEDRLRFGLDDDTNVGAGGDSKTSGGRRRRDGSSKVVTPRDTPRPLPRETSSMDEISEVDFELYSKTVAKALSRGHQSVRQEILNFLEAQWGQEPGSEVVHSDFPPFDFHIGQLERKEIERIEIDITVQRKKDSFKVDYACRTSYRPWISDAGASVGLDNYSKSRSSSLQVDRQRIGRGHRLGEVPNHGLPRPEVSDSSANPRANSCAPAWSSLSSEDRMRFGLDGASSGAPAPNSARKLKGPSSDPGAVRPHAQARAHFGDSLEEDVQNLERAMQKASINTNRAMQTASINANYGLGPPSGAHGAGAFRQQSNAPWSARGLSQDALSMAYATNHREPLAYAPAMARTITQLEAAGATPRYLADLEESERKLHQLRMG